MLLRLINCRFIIIILFGTVSAELSGEISRLTLSSIYGTLFPFPGPSAPAPQQGWI